MQESVDAEKKARNLIDKMLPRCRMDYHTRRGNPVPDKGYFAVEEVETPSGPMDYGLYILMGFFLVMLRLSQRQLEFLVY